MTNGQVVERDRPDWRMIWGVSLLLVATTSVPVVWGSLRQTSKLVQLRRSPPTPVDYTVYLAQIRQSAEGEWLLSDRFTAEPQGWGNLNTYWVAVGKVAALLHLSPALTFEFARLLGIPLAVLAVDLLASQVLVQRSQRRLALLLLAFAGGLGAYALLGLRLAVPAPYKFSVPLDIGGPLGVWGSVVASGHVAAAFALVALITASWAQALRTLAWRWTLVSGGLAALLFSFHPFEVPLVGSLVVITALVWALPRGRLLPATLRTGVWVALACAPVVYTVLAVLRDPITAARATQNATPGVPLWLTLVSLGVLGTAGLIGWWRVLPRWRSADPAVLLLLIWLPLQLVLLHLPIVFQRRLNIGLFLPFVLLGVGVLAEWAKRLRLAIEGRWRGLGRAGVAVFAVVVLLPSPVFQLAYATSLVHQRWELLYQPRPLLAGLEWVSQHTPQASVILSDGAVGNLVPAYAGRTTVVGHGVETVAFHQKSALVRAYFTNQLSTSQRRNLYAQQRVTHVLVSQPERVFGFTPGAELSEEYTNDALTVYRVLP